jgi:hypothetical protein
VDGLVDFKGLAAIAATFGSAMEMSGTSAADMPAMDSTVVVCCPEEHCLGHKQSDERDGTKSLGST